MIEKKASSSDDVDFSRYLDVVLHRRWIIASITTMVLAVMALVTFMARPVYQATTMIVIEKERGGAATAMAGTHVENSNDDYYQTQYKLLQSRSLLQKVYEDLRLAERPEFKSGVESFRKAIIVAPIIRSRLVNVKANSFDPQLAARMANAVCETFVAQNLSNQLFISKDVLQALQARDGSRARYDSLPPVVNNPLIQTLKGQYAMQEHKVAELSQRLMPKHPEMIAARTSLAALRSEIDAETDKIVAAMKTELSGQLNGNNVRVIDPAEVPERPIKPQKRKSLLLGLLGGLALGLSVAFLIEMLDQTIHTQEDIEEKLRLPFLGIIPASGQKQGRPYQPLLHSELSLTSEAFRNARTMVDFAGVSQKSKSLLVTSTVQSEGKTYVASNLAVAFSQLGERVLIIDGDLRRPKLHSTFGLSSARGLSDFLAKGLDVSEIRDLLQATEVPGVDALPCGPRPPNPSELLNTPRLAALVAWAATTYDRVVVDCTPMFPINDTLLWGRHIPSGVFVARYGATRVPLIVTACQKLQAGGIKPLGVVINAARAGGLSYSSYGYYYQKTYQAQEA